MTRHSISLNRMKRRINKKNVLKYPLNIIMKIPIYFYEQKVYFCFSGIKKISTLEQYKQSGVEELSNEINRFHPLDM